MTNQHCAVIASLSPDVTAGHSLYTTVEQSAPRRVQHLSLLTQAIISQASLTLCDTFERVYDLLQFAWAGRHWTAFINTTCVRIMHTKDIISSSAQAMHAVSTH